YSSKVTLGSTFYADQDQPNNTSRLHKGMSVISLAASIPMVITDISNDGTTFTVSSQQPILAFNLLYLTFADLYPAGGTWNAYGNSFNRPTASIGGRAHALSFDAQGGFSPTLPPNWTATPTTGTITLGPWAPAVMVNGNLLITGSNSNDRIDVRPTGH